MPIVNILVSPRPMKQLVVKTAANGPINEAQVGDGSYESLFNTYWKLGWAGDTLKLFKVEEDSTLTEVTPLDEFPTLNYGDVTNLSLAFDQAGRNVIAWEEANTIKVRQYNAAQTAYTTRGNFPGHDPVIYNEGAASMSSSINNLILFYMSEDRLNLLYRLQSELYNTAHLVETYTEPRYITGVESKFYQYEVGMKDYSEAPSSYLSDYYPIQLKDRMSASVIGPTDGVYQEVVIAKTLPMDSMVSSVSGPTGGEYRGSIIVREVPQDNLTSTVTGPTSGVYTPVIIVHSTVGTNYTQDVLTSTVAGPTSGIYSLVVLVYTIPNNDNMTASVTGPTGGSYTLA